MTGGKVSNVLVDLKRTVAYICPFCSNISSKYISVFNFSGKDRIKLICPTHGCHETCVTIAPKNEKYKLDIECPLCGDKHSYSISRDGFWHKGLITYKCPAAGIDIFFAGERREVEKILEDNSDVYSDIIDDFGDGADADMSFDLLYEIIDRLHILKDSHHVSCRCGCEDVDINVVKGNVILSCARCRASKVIETNEETLMRLLNSHAVVIGN